MDFSTVKEIDKIEYQGKDFYAKDRNTKRLFLHIKENSKLWIYQYTSPALFKQRRIALGAYPTETTLKEAREKAKELNNKIFRGIDPLEEKQLQKKEAKELKQKEEAEKTHQIHLVVDNWLKNIYIKQVAPITFKKETERIYNHIIKHFGKFDTDGKIILSKPIEKITDDEISELLKNINSEKPETAKRLYAHCNRIWEYAKDKKIANNIFENISKYYTLLTDHKAKHHPKITDENILKELLMAIENHQNPYIRLPLKFVSYTPFRASNFIYLKWSQIDFDNKLLTIPREQMKVKGDEYPDFKVPMTKQIIEILTECKKTFNNAVWVFPSAINPNNPISDTALRNHLVKMGFDDDGKRTKLHGFRGTFRTLVETHANEHGFRFEAMEAVLDHKTNKKSVKAYMHEANYTDQIGEVLEWYNDYLDLIQKG